MDPFKSNIDHLTPELMQKYLDGNLSREECHEVEKLLAESDFESEAVEGFQGNPVNLEDDLVQLNQNLRQRIRKEKVLFPLWFKIAASLLIIAASTVLVINYGLNSSEIQNEISSAKTDETSVNPSKNEVLANQDSLLALREEVETPEPEPITNITLDEDFQPESIQNQENQTNLRTVAPAETEGDEFTEKMDVKENVAEVLSGKVSGILADESPIEEDKTLDEDKTEERDSEATMAPAALERAEIAQPSTVKEILEKAKRSRRPIRSASTQALVDKKIQGQVTAVDDGEPLPGVNIALKDTDIGTVTDIDGNYSLNTQGSKEKTLVVSFIGMSTQEVEVGGRSQVDIQLSADVSQLSEVVVTGYGIEKKRQASTTIVPANPEGGKAAYRKYLQDNVIMPPDSIVSKVTVRFNVLPDGTLSNFSVNKAPGPAYQEEAIRLIKEGPRWIPATENNAAVTDQIKVRIRFK
ncbi:MAG: carboxypeptidase-like regulatory domain-containing protein [Bacteroidota bacterium]